MKNATIKKPKGSAVIFLLTALSNFSTVALELLCTTLLNQAPKLTTPISLILRFKLDTLLLACSTLISKT